MNLSLHPTWLTLCLAILIVAGAGYLCLTGYRRNPRRLTLWLEILQFSIFVFLAFLLLEPEIIHSSPIKGQSQIAILIDESESMTTRDVSISDDKTLTRDEAIKHILASPSLNKLKAEGPITIIPFSKPTIVQGGQKMQSGTDLASPILGLLDQPNNWKAVILLSDGNHNMPPSPLLAAQQLRVRAIPLLSVPIGSPTPLPDLAIDKINIPTYGIIDEIIKIPFSIHNTMGEDIHTSVTLKSLKTDKQQQRDIIIPARGEYAGSFDWKITKEGLNDLEISIPIALGETIIDNNQTTFQLSGRKESIRALVIDSLPRWEYRFIRNALYRDPGVELHTLLLHPNLSIAGEGPGYITRFPSARDELSRYDVVFIGDIGIGANGLSQEDMAQLVDLVKNKASGIVFLPGYQGKQLELLGSPLGDLLPVTLDKELPQGTLSPDRIPLQLTTEGKQSLLTMLSDSEHDNDDIWQQLPGFNWYAPVVRAKAGANILAVHPTAKNPYGRIPLLVTQPYGNGKVLFMGTDAAWRWRRGVEDKYHYRFWRQVARWMSYRRNMASGQQVRLMISPERPELGDDITVTALISDKQGAPINKEDAFLDITSPSGDKMKQQMTQTQGSWGTYSTSFPLNQSGDWKIIASSASLHEVVELTISTPDNILEKKGLPVNTQLLEEMAFISGGELVPISAIDTLINKIKAHPEQQPNQLRFRLWNNSIVLALLIGLLTTFWIGRKINGTI
ncbi:MAG: FixH family protein [Akkermansia sp.]